LTTPVSTQPTPAGLPSRPAGRRLLVAALSGTLLSWEGGSSCLGGGEVMGRAASLDRRLVVVRISPLNETAAAVD
jgi:hypothetical protein